MDKEFIANLAEVLRVGLGEFLATWCIIEIVEQDTHDDDDCHTFVNVSREVPDHDGEKHQRLLISLQLLNDHVLVNGEIHEYCHPQFPNSILYGVARVFNRNPGFNDIVEHAKVIADENPEAGIQEFVETCRASPVHSRFIDDNFSKIFRFQMSPDRLKKAKVVAWLDSLEFPTIEDLLK